MNSSEGGQKCLRLFLDYEKAMFRRHIIKVAIIFFCFSTVFFRFILWHIKVKANSRSYCGKYFPFHASYLLPASVPVHFLVKAENAT